MLSPLTPLAPLLSVKSPPARPDPASRHATAVTVPNSASAFVPLPDTVIATELLAPVASDVTTMLVALAADTAAPVICPLSAVAQFAVVSQFAVIEIVCGPPPSTTTIRSSFALVKSNKANESPVSVPEVAPARPATAVTVPNSASAFVPLPDTVIATELLAPVASDVTTMLVALAADTAAPVICPLSAVAQFAVVSQFAVIEIVCGPPPSTTTIRSSFALVKSNTPNESPVSVPAEAAAVVPPKPAEIESAAPAALAPSALRIVPTVTESANVVACDTDTLELVAVTTAVPSGDIVNVVGEMVA